MPPVVGAWKTQSRLQRERNKEGKNNEIGKSVGERRRELLYGRHRGKAEG